MQDPSILKELRGAGVVLTDFGAGQPEINLLIGADMTGNLLTGRIAQTKCGPVAVETRLGWTLMGNITDENSSDSTELVTSMMVTDASITDLWKLDVIGITDATETQSRKELEEAAMIYFLQTTTRNTDGRFEVALPWIEGHPQLKSNEDIAMKRLETTAKKLESIGRFEDYQNVFDDWLAEGVIEEVPKHEIGNDCHYLPHRAVIKENSETTKIRPVFDASAKGKGGTSLNECLEKGRNLLELIPKIIVGFRLRKIGIVSDIRKAFLQISLKPRERDFLRFLWKEKGKNTVRIFRHCRVVFGISSSPFLLAAVLKELLVGVPDEWKDTALKLQKSMYVDNCVTSLDSSYEMKKFVHESVQLMAAGKFDLRGWIWNNAQNRLDPAIDEPERLISVLGLLWNVGKDILTLDLRSFSLNDEQPATKRKILPLAHQLYDPIGFSCPVSLQPKILLQEAWKLNVGWDVALPEDFNKTFRKWRLELPLLKQIEIPRWVFNQKMDRSSWSLHTFTDASKNAYAAAVVLRAETDDVVSIQLLLAKSRVAPVKLMTIPRLELLGCCIGARLCEAAKMYLEYPEIPSFYWTDSSNALCWIKRMDQWATFVGNRVMEIRRLSNPDDWRHVKGSMNPADLPSRGCSPKMLLQSKWWEGPEWLRRSTESWPMSELSFDAEVVNSERKKTICSNLSVEENPSWYVRHNNYTKIVRMLAGMRRFLQNCRKVNVKMTGDLALNEVKDAELELFKLVQMETFDSSNSKMKDVPKQLNAKRDSNGVWRLCTKIFLRQDSKSFRSPVLLPAEHEVSYLLIQKVHEESSHAGVQVLMSILREKFWITKSRKIIAQVIRKCGRCRRFEVRKAEVEPAPLPEDRVKDAVVFEVTGVDLAGPLYLKDKPKAWVVIFTCAVYRAVHFEIVSSLSTDAFLQSLRRFVSHCGRPSKIYSDNGTNFMGSANLLKKLDWDKIVSSSYGSSHPVHPIQWQFNPPSAPWWGGWWERIVRMVKQILRKVLGKACLDFEEMMTILCDCKQVINSRPLTYVSEDCEDLVPLTPSMFLHEIVEDGMPDVDQIDGTSLNKRLQYRRKVRDDLRKRFRCEYLGMLVHHQGENKTVKSVKVGDVLLVGSDGKKRLDWPMAKVLEVFPGKDGAVRVAKVKTAMGDIIRPLQRLYPLEVTGVDRVELQKVIEDTSIREEVEAPGVKTTRCGRRVKTPIRFE